MASPFKCILFDIDDTLYSSSTGIAQACKKNIEDYLVRRCLVSEEQAISLRIELFGTYGSSLAGLTALGYDIHPDEYHSFVHGRLPYELIKPDPQLRELLLSIRQNKILFTNSDIKHARRVLEKLGIDEDFFDKIICFETLNAQLFIKNRSLQDLPPPVFLKPAIAAMEAAVQLAGCNDPSSILFLDDSERNIAAGKAVGLCTALVGKKMKIKEADYVVETINCLRLTIPEIWGDKKQEKEDDHEIVMRSELDNMIPLAQQVEA